MEIFGTTAKLIENEADVSYGGQETPRNGTHSSARLLDLRSSNASCLASAHTTDTRKGMNAIFYGKKAKFC